MDHPWVIDDDRPHGRDVGHADVLQAIVGERSGGPRDEIVGGLLISEQTQDEREQCVRDRLNW